MCCYVRRARNCQGWIDQCPFRNDPTGCDTDLHESVWIGNNSNRAHFRTGPGRRRNSDDFDDRSGHGVFAIIFLQWSWVLQEDRCALSQVHVAAPADPDDDIRIELASGFCGCLNRLQVNFGPPLGKDQDLTSAFLQQSFDTISDTTLDDVSVRADHHTLPEFLADIAEFF